LASVTTAIVRAGGVISPTSAEYGVAAEPSPLPALTAAVCEAATFNTVMVASTLTGEPTASLIVSVHV
jgi:hypothetical protein